MRAWLMVVTGVLAAMPCFAQQSAFGSGKSSFGGSAFGQSQDSFSRERKQPAASAAAPAVTVSPTAPVAPEPQASTPPVLPAVANRSATQQPAAAQPGTAAPVAANRAVQPVKEASDLDKVLAYIAAQEERTPSMVTSELHSFFPGRRVEESDR